jgi:hypothetical protein
MPVICYRKKNFGADRLDKIEKVNAIVNEYMEKGFELTLRMVYYQMVARGFIPNNMREYKNLGDVVNDGRLAGLIDWTAIVDLTRELNDLSHWESPSSIIDAVSKQYRIDKWSDQEHRIEVWAEKDAVKGVILPACQRLDIPFFSCRGYTSQSEMWEAAMRLRRHIDNGQTPLILHLGDHDPSGKDMTRDITDRLAEFAGREIEINRLALNMDQIRQYNPPPNPAKITDSRATAYIAEFGQESWELDALTPEVMAALIETAVMAVRDEEKWDAAVAEENEQREQLVKVSAKWNEIIDSL